MSEKNLQQNNNSLSEKSYFPITDILQVGKENAISTADLVKITGVLRQGIYRNGLHWSVMQGRLYVAVREADIGGQRTGRSF